MERISLADIPLMPVEYKGEYNKNCGYTKTTPRRWTDKEIEWLKGMQKSGYTRKQIAQSMDRSETSISIKLKRLGKENNTYNNNHVIEKYDLNNQFLEKIKPKTILDLYCGEKSFYKSKNLYKVTSNDINKDIAADYHSDAFKLICKLYSENKKYDLVDLDPFGSAYDCFDIAVKMAKKGLVITLGELGHKRWKRLDYVRTHYGINHYDDFTMDNIIKNIQEIGKRNKKELIVFQKRTWQHIGRVWFLIEPRKVTEQWD